MEAQVIIITSLPLTVMLSNEPVYDVYRWAGCPCSLYPLLFLSCLLCLWTDVCLAMDGRFGSAVQRARKAIVRQNSNLSDSILTQRSLLGTGRAPAALYHPPLHVPGMAGMPALHRHPQRTATVRALSSCKALAV